MEPSYSIDNKLLLAPMVRIGTTPFRLLCLKYGADFIFTEEIIAKKLMHCKKFYNAELNCNEYISLRDGNLVLRISPEERSKLVLQIGASDPEDALKAVMVVKEDIIAVDLNMGCPKHFSTHGNMGSALLLQPELAKEKLVKESGLPVSCKIRLLHDKEKQEKLIETLQGTGIRYFTIHLRLKDQPSKYKARWRELSEVARVAKIPFVTNGDIFTPKDIMYLKSKNLCKGFMIARGAIHNPRIFEEFKNYTMDQFLSEEDFNISEDEEDNGISFEQVNDTKIRNDEDVRASSNLAKLIEKRYGQTSVDILPIVREYVEIALKIGNCYKNTKYNVLYILKTHKKHLSLFVKIQSSKNYADLCSLLEMSDAYELYVNLDMVKFYDNSYYKNKKYLNEK